MTDKYYTHIIRKYNKKIEKLASGYAPSLVELQHIKVVIFDIYGTLLISEKKLRTEDYMKTGCIRTNREAVKNFIWLKHKYSIAYNLPGLIKRLKEEKDTIHTSLKAEGIDFPEIDIVAIWEKILATHNTNLARRCAFEFEMAGINTNPTGNLQALFIHLMSRNIRIGIVSNAQFYTEKILGFFLNLKNGKIQLDAELVFYSYRHRTAKPSPVLFGKVLEKIKAAGLEPHNVLYIGNDRENDLQPAAEMGFKTALFAGDRRCTADETHGSAEPALIITDWKQIKSIIR